MLRVVVIIHMTNEKDINTYSIPILNSTGYFSVSQHLGFVTILQQITRWFFLVYHIPSMSPETQVEAGLGEVFMVF